MSDRARGSRSAREGSYFAREGSRSTRRGSVGTREGGGLESLRERVMGLTDMGTVYLASYLLTRLWMLGEEEGELVRVVERAEEL